MFVSYGGIGLDPAADEACRVPAMSHMTNRLLDGLIESWSGLGAVYLNPPYGQTRQWIAKAYAEYAAGHIPAAILLLQADTSTRWYCRLRHDPRTVVCLLRGRLRFVHADRDVPGDAATFASLLAYIGPWPGTFVAAFADLGDCLYPAVGPEPAWPDWVGLEHEGPS